MLDLHLKIYNIPKNRDWAGIFLDDADLYLLAIYTT